MLRVIGAGLPRTGTMTLKHALETLLGAPCHHMSEVFQHLDTHPAGFLAAARGEAVDWDGLLGGYAAAVDWPASAFYAELAERYPDAVVLLSRRDSFAAWWKSCNDTIFTGMDTGEFASPEWRAMIDAIWEQTFDGADRGDPAAVEAAYDRYHERVRAAVPPERLVEFRTGAGWGPLCDALGLPVPSEPFPHLNSTKEWQERTGDVPPGGIGAA
ncbi:sulfotransferase family protein [Glycomyces terrestris]|uniref:Sulfotransferase family protein n=1 Tax=Glycomyces terrestris TaxID=2493553 RepID=A0A426V157_9ACTN|nr:sulfotransferase family protein [Glycomyces terrestris]RRS00576.1 sulfotransferase family protein [Glycomyces terrestris]